MKFKSIKISPIYILIIICMLPLIIIPFLTEEQDSFNTSFLVSNILTTPTEDTEFSYDYAINLPEDQWVPINYDYLDKPQNYITKGTIEKQSTHTVYLTIPRSDVIYGVYLEDEPIPRTIINYEKDREMLYSYYIIPPQSVGKDFYIFAKNPISENFDHASSFAYGSLPQLQIKALHSSLGNFFFALYVTIFSVVVLCIYHVSKIKTSSLVFMYTTLFYMTALFSILNNVFIKYVFYVNINFVDTVTYTLMFLIAITGFYFNLHMLTKQYPRLESFFIWIFGFLTLLCLYFYINVLTDTPNLLDLETTILTLLFLFSMLILLGIFVDYTNPGDLIDSLIVVAYNTFFALLLYDYIGGNRYSSENYLLPVTLVMVLVYLRINYSFKSRQKRTDELNKKLSSEKDIIDKFHMSNITGFFGGTVKELSQRISTDAKNLIPNITEFFIASVNDYGNIEILMQENMESDLSCANILLESYHKHEIPNMFYISDLNKNQLHAIYRANTYEILFIHIKKADEFTENDITTLDVILPSISASYNSNKVYAEIMQTQEEFVTIFANSLNEFSGNKNNIRAFKAYSDLICAANNFDDMETYNFRLGTCLFNIGKFSIPDAIRNGYEIKRTQYEYYIEHTIAGYEMLHKISGNIMEIAAVCSLEHHENYDGSGYLHKKERDISLYARMTRVILEFDMYVKENIDAENFTLESAFFHLDKMSGSILDPVLVKIFKREKNKISKIIKNVY
ncbi:MAG: HD-GYP domain-containing protein [Lachnospirales bacterium]